MRLAARRGARNHAGVFANRLKTSTPPDSGPTPALAVLVTLDAPAVDGAELRLFDRTALERQVECAAALGCSEVWAIGAIGRAQAISLRHFTEGLGLRFRELGGPHALAEVVMPGERLLVFQAGLMPDLSAWPLGKGASDEGAQGAVLTLPAEVGADAGFERIDYSRSWAGALLIPGSLVPRLRDLPEDAEAASALLRIALQAGIATCPVEPKHLQDASWFIPAGAEDVRMAEESWLSRQTIAPPGSSLSARAAAFVVRRTGAPWVARREAVPGVLLAAFVLVAVGIWLSAQQVVVAGFGALALAAPVLEATFVVRASQAARLGPAASRRRSWQPLRGLLDGALLCAGLLTIAGDPIEQLFAPLVLLAAFHAGPKGPAPRWQVLRDRGLAALVIAVGAALHSAQAGIMLAALGLLALNILQSRQGTPVREG